MKKDWRGSIWVCSFIFWVLLQAARISGLDGCTKSSSLVGYQADLTMVQHQLRGRIQVLDDCSFRVTRFDMIAGSSEVVWLGAAGTDFMSLTQGFPVSQDRLNQTNYANFTMEVTLDKNVRWEQVQVLAVWDNRTASLFGHVQLNSTKLSDGSDPTLQQKLPPTIFDNCVNLSSQYRLRWNLNKDNGSVELGLEATIPETRYMAFGWASPKASRYLMLESDVVVAGFKDRNIPFAEDYYINKYSECNWDFDNPSGVCPDFLYQSSSAGNVSLNSSRLVYGQHVDGVALIRYVRPLASQNPKLDIEVDPDQNMTVIWALGPLKPPDSLRPFQLPQNHGGPGRVNFGHRQLVLSEPADECTGPLVAAEVESVDIIVADRGSPLLVTVDDAVHYPDPPSPSKVIYINKKEAPVLKVERGVEVIFSIQAGHDLAFYVTSDPVGGASNPNETIYAGGADSHGVPSRPLALSWLPNRTTPDEVYYQAYFEKKMGWKIQVVDGGLSDMYNSSVLLAEQQVTFFWTTTGKNISFAVRAERKSGYLAIGFGREMVNSFAYVGWVGADGTGYVKSYWIDGRDAASIHPTTEELWDQKCSSERGMLTFEFTRGLQPVCDPQDKICKKNLVDPALPLKVIWAMGARWDSNFPSDRNMHDRTSSRATVVHLAKGAAEADTEVKPVLVVHGFLMFLAWGLLFPGGIIAARYLKHLENNVWFQAHTYLQYSGVTVMLLGLLFAAAELRGLHTETFHVKIGLLTILLACWQPVNAYFRPAKAAPGEQPTRRRLFWEYLHIYTGRGSLVLGVVTLVTGMSLLGDIYGTQQVRGYEWALFAWLFVVAGLVGYWELRHFWSKGKRKAPLDAAQIEVLDTDDEVDDSRDLLLQRPRLTSGGMEVQLEAFH